ncbi:MAG: phosphoadenosine phosphosulfate reductase family protein [Desulfitobacteriia bacterium]
MKVYWCNKCKAPIINHKTCYCGSESSYMSTDARPVFPEERHLLYIITGNKRFIEEPVWRGKNTKYFINGKPEVITLDFIDQITNFKEISDYLKNVDLTEDYRKFQLEINKFVLNNEQHFLRMEYKAIEFIKKVVLERPNSIKVVSFSGGKDSTVVSHLVRRALSTSAVLHLFGNTTLEYPHTYEYIRRFRTENPRTPFFISKSNHGFMELCKSMGPPSRVMSWCCTVFKTGPLNNMIHSFAKDKKLLTFYGIRGVESIERNKYQDVIDVDFGGFHKDSNVSISPKITQQLVTSPIFEWLDIDIWLYILTHNLDFNEGYRLGFSRVGCWCCPNDSKWSEFLARIYIPDQYKEWNNFLIQFASKIGKPDPEVYVKTGKWKARQGGAGLNNNQIYVEAKPCVDEEFGRTFSLAKPISPELYEYFRPFGVVSRELGRKLLNEVLILDRTTKKPIIKLQGANNSYTLKVVCINPTNYRLLSQRIDCQLRKYQSCIGCLGCVSICPYNAISYADGTYKILENKCKGCLQCINPWKGGCLMTKVLAFRRGV